MTHAWCRDPSRDERVRAAEDGRTGPLPTLKECIEGQKQLQTARPCGGTDPAPSRGERGAADTCMQAERVTLEITHDGKHGPVSTWPFECGSYGKGVRVVEEELSDAWAQRLARLTAERDAAIRSRDDLRKSWLRSEESGTRLLAQRNAALDDADALRKRVAEPEAASGGGEGEADAWGIVRDGNVESVTHRRFRGEAECCAARLVGTVVPLYRSPPPPRGWLTKEERELIAGITDDDEYTEEGQNIAKGLLARSTPPEVRLPLADLGDRLLRDSVIHALAEAGVAVKLPPGPEGDG